MTVKLSELKKVQIMTASDIFEIMRLILLKRSKRDRTREHFWVMALGPGRRIVSIELISLGSAKRVIVEPMEVYSIPLQKRAINIVLIHNHPSGILSPSEADKDLTDLLLQVGFLTRIPVLDHLIISETGYYSFEGTGLLEELRYSNKYVPDRIERLKYERAAMERGQAEGEQKAKREMARILKKQGVDIDVIIKATGLSRATIAQLKAKT